MDNALIFLHMHVAQDCLWVALDFMLCIVHRSDNPCLYKAVLPVGLTPIS